jgi:hypothetical protein
LQLSSTPDLSLDHFEGSGSQALARLPAEALPKAGHK